ncbi:hypothetical protein [Phenylobacterium immobile]|uniref:hypothetical protein n=1 Tax=Phenylobacterium immobile TaxID=21 RepID=UPI000A928D7C|nr:hypothetical protein [Phenylobacterium immobile]
MTALAEAVRDELARPAPAFAQSFAEALAAETPDAAAVLFYGSVLRSGDREGVLDFYVLTASPPKRLVSRWLWPDVGYREWNDGEGRLRAKVAVMSLAQFAHAAGGQGLDTTIWTRFVQPSVLAWSRDAAAAAAVHSAAEQAARTAARFAAALGPRCAPPLDYWTALFRQTYAAEFRVEPGGREQAILAVDPDRYARRITQAWTADGLAFDQAEGQLAPRPSDRAAVLRAWRRRRTFGRPLNIARLIKAAFTFEGAARYAVWKIERHTGVALPLTPWTERHPVLAAPAMMLKLWRARRGRP